MNAKNVADTSDKRRHYAHITRYTGVSRGNWMNPLELL